MEIESTYFSPHLPWDSFLFPEERELSLTIRISVLFLFLTSSISVMDWSHPGDTLSSECPLGPKARNEAMI